MTNICDNVVFARTSTASMCHEQYVVDAVYALQGGRTRVLLAWVGYLGAFRY